MDFASLSGATPFLLAAQLGLVDVAKALKAITEIPKRGCDKAIAKVSQRGHEDTVTYLLDLCLPLEGEACDLSEAVRHASAHGYENIDTKILEHAKSQKVLDLLSLDALICQAALFGYESQTKLFLQYGADVNTVMNQRTPLQYAVENGHASVVHYLLEVGKADVDSTAEAETDAPILLAVSKGYEAVVEDLLVFGADTAVRTRQPQHGPEGVVHLPEALHIAIWDREAAFAEMILDIFYTKATGAVLEDLSAVLLDSRRDVPRS
ncbi:ankyrin repeat-containing domain protein [Apodospora peruviana]|uniref:Ankyrin repeat-containing domain protein n=1 Tax=Apodospora peruviana TaxID=516989 RepID=A0AAE0IKP9_9PEZI|nr:ankyrin repeat-containing domain protein [Apodospora peruviana]